MKKEVGELSQTSGAILPGSDYYYYSSTSTVNHEYPAAKARFINCIGLGDSSNYHLYQID